MNGLDVDRDALLTVEEVAQLLRVPKSWVYEHTRVSSNPRLPDVRLGKYLRSRCADINDFVKRACGNYVAHGFNRQ